MQDHLTSLTSLTSSTSSISFSTFGPLPSGGPSHSFAQLKADYVGSVTSRHARLRVIYGSSEMITELVFMIKLTRSSKASNESILVVPEYLLAGTCLLFWTKIPYLCTPSPGTHASIPA